MFCFYLFLIFLHLIPYYILNYQASLRRAGAKEVHFLVASPVVQYPCYFGIDTPYRKELIGANHSLEEIREIIGCDSLGYLSMEGMYKCFNTNQGYCVGCFNGIYPVATPIEGER